MVRVDVSELLVDEELGATTFTRMRPTTGFVAGSEGRSVDTYASATVNGIVQPARTKDAQLLPEGTRLSDAKSFFTSSDLSAGDGHSQKPDIIVHESKRYRVMHVEDLGNHGMVRAIGLYFTGGT